MGHKAKGASPEWPKGSARVGLKVGEVLDKVAQAGSETAVPATLCYYSCETAPSTGLPHPLLIIPGRPYNLHVTPQFPLTAVRLCTIF